MKSRLGKIARLPLSIREELNTRLLEGDPAHLLIEWLNTDPAVLDVLNTDFNGELVSTQNIGEWRRGGYMEWALVRECAATARGLSESSEDVASTGISAEHLLTVLTVQYARILNELDTVPAEELDRKLNLLRKLTNAALAMRRREFHAARLEIARERSEIARGRLELAREKQLSKSASSGSSAASASTESTAAPRKKAPKSDASENGSSSNAEASASLDQHRRDALHPETTVAPQKAPAPIASQNGASPEAGAAASSGQSSWREALNRKLRHQSR